MKTKEHATLLREQGLSYAEVAQQTGYSVDWCKKNLKDVQKNRHEKVVIEQAIKKAQSTDGISNGEITYLVRSIYPLDLNNKEYATMVEKAKARFKAAINKSPNTVIRPYWMQPENAQLSLNAVLSAVDNISQRMTDIVFDIRQSFGLDLSYDNSLRYAIIKMLQGSTLAREGMENHCNLLSEIANELDRRNRPDSCTFSAPLNTCLQKCALFPTDSEKCIVHSSTLSEDVVLDLDIADNLITLDEL